MHQRFDHFEHGGPVQTSRYSTGETPPIKARHKGTIPHLETTCMRFNTSAWRRRRPSAGPDRSQLLQILPSLTVRQFFSVSAYFACCANIGGRLVFSRRQCFCRRQYFSMCQGFSTWTNELQRLQTLYVSFLKIDLLTGFAASCLADFIDWRYIHSWFVFSTQLVTVAPMDKGTILTYCCPFTVPSLWPPPPSPVPNVHYSVWLWVGGGGVWNVLCTIFCRSFTLCFWPDSEPAKLLHHPKQKWPVKTTLRDWCL